MALTATLSLIFQILSIYVVVKRRNSIAGNHTSSMRNVNSSEQNENKHETFQKQMKKAERKLEHRMYFNTLIIFIIMLFKSCTYLINSFGIQIFNFTAYEIYCFSGDLFSMMNPIILIFLSKNIRVMLIQFLTLKKYAFQ